MMNLYQLTKQEKIVVAKRQKGESISLGGNVVNPQHFLQFMCFLNCLNFIYLQGPTKRT